MSKPASNLDPNWITGLSDGDGSFFCEAFIIKDSNVSLGWNVQFYYSIIAAINEPNLKLLTDINNYFDNSPPIGVASYKIYWAARPNKIYI